MAGLMQGLEIGKRAMMTYQASMQTIGHNIANVDTPGFSRQRVLISTSMPESSVYGTIGSGVKVDGIVGIRDSFLITQYRQAQESLGNWSYQEKTLSQIESVFNEPQDNSLNDMLSEFWNAWSQLSTDSDDASNRNALLSSTEQLINGFHQLSDSLTDLRDATDRDLTNLTSEINRMTNEIAQLNQQIKTQELGGEEASDLRDARGLLIDELSAIIDVNVREDADGAVAVSMGSMILVDGSASMNIEAKAENKDGQLTHRLVWQGTEVSLKNTNGELAGLMKSRDEIIPDYLEQLDELASAIVTEINNLHQSGYGLDGSTNVAFFDPNYTDAAGIRLNQEVANNINRIACSESSDPDVRDGNIALAISGLRDSALMDNGTTTFNEFYNSVVGSLGVQSKEASSFANNYELLSNQIDNQRQSVQGVSLDEEMANLVKVQNAYEAAARVITVMDESLDLVINAMGRVGL